MDKYQERYLDHIENKLKRKQIKNSYSDQTKRSFLEVMDNRKSVRRFNGNTVYEAGKLMKQAIDLAPSSCNRKGIYIREIEPKYAEKRLVGGKSWLDKAQRVFFLFGAKECYKNPKEVAYMPYLDAGFIVQNMYLLCELNGIGCCFVNPNLKAPIDIGIDDYFVGAIAVGDY